MASASQSTQAYKKLLMDFSSDEEDDDLLNIKVFSSSSRKKKAEECLSQDSTASLVTEKSAPSPPTTPLTSEVIEAKAQQAIKDLTFPIIKKNNRMDELGFLKRKYRKSDKQPTWYPCRTCHPDEGIGIIEEKEKMSNKFILVRFLGYQSQNAGSYDRIPVREFHLMTLENRDPAFETYKKVLADQFKNDPIGLRTEELAILEMWKMIEQRETGESTSPDKETQKEPAAPLSHAKTTAVKQFFQSQASYESDSSCTDDDEEDIDLQLEPGKKGALRDGDVIEYYDPIGVVGRDEWLRRATVLGIDPKNKSLPLNLSSGDHLDKSIKIKCIQRRLRGKVINNPDGRFRPLSDYHLRTCGTMDMIAFSKMAAFGKKVREETQEQIDSFWTKDKSKEGVSEESSESIYDAPSQAVMPVQQNIKPAATPREPAWKTHLTALLESTKEQMEKSKRFKPSMKPEQIEILLKVWEFLQTQLDNSNTGHNTKTILPAFADHLKISFSRLDAVMHGDEKKALSIPNKIELNNIFKKFLENPTSLKFNDIKESRRKQSLKRRRQSCPQGGEPSSSESKKRADRRQSLQVFRSHETSSVARKPARPAREPPVVALKRKRKSASGILRTSSTDSCDTCSSVASKKKARKSSKPMNQESMIEKEKRELQRMIREIKEQKEKNKRFRSHMSAEKLEIAVSVWNYLVDKKQQTEKIITELASEFDISHKKLTRFLKGDEDKYLGEYAQTQIAKMLASWLEEQKAKAEQDDEPNKEQHEESKAPDQAGQED